MITVQSLLFFFITYKLQFWVLGESVLKTTCSLMFYFWFMGKKHQLQILSLLTNHSVCLMMADLLNESGDSLNDPSNLLNNRCKKKVIKLG